MGSWGSHGKPVLGKTAGVDYIPQASSKPWASSSHLLIVSNCFLLLARTFIRNLCWGYPAQESLIPMEGKQGHLVRAQNGELGRPVELVEHSHLGRAFSKAAYPAL